MRLVVRLFARLRERAGSGELVLDDLPDGLDVAGLKRALTERHPELGSLEAVRGVVGTAYVEDSRALAEGDEVSLLPPVSGGDPGSGSGSGSGSDSAGPDAVAALARGRFELSSEPLDAAAAQARVAHPSCGAICVFTGTTRDANRGQAVERLEYEAFAAMSGPEMARIFERCVAAHGDPDGARPERALRMLCQHRVGVVGVGEPSVVIAVASPHRAPAFDAARFLIDELKASLPVWKKEHYEGGAHWIGDRS